MLSPHRPLSRPDDGLACSASTVPACDPTSSEPSWRRPVLVTLAVSAVVTALSYGLPADYAATGVGFSFLLATYWLAVRGRSDAEVQAHGLSLGGLLLRTPLSATRLAKDTLRAAGWALALGLVVFPPFVFAWLKWWQPPSGFRFVAPPDLLDEVLGQVLVIALPEEAFFRGYLQTELDRRFPPRFKVLGARLGLGVVLASGLFAVGHLLTEPHPNRLAVFFPALVFGWLRAKTGGIGAGVLFHAACNLLTATLARGFALG
ncbi:MAG: CPBP family intramembrane metalloprotease [Polyangiaceae bacterium]|nr:CPBP family intramembrane metalloprotease [Polyangiaceae bacterium]MCW5789584.1 CPBP family intramembrane metalloprotease [Polyangiaceae bacterium]